MIGFTISAALAASFILAAEQGQEKPRKTKKDLPNMIRVVQDKDKANVTRREAVRALGEIGPEAKDAVPVLIKALDNPQIMWDAMIALGKIGPTAKKASSPLLHLLYKHRNGKFAQDAIKALVRISCPPEDLAVPLVVILEEKRGKVRAKDGICKLCIVTLSTMKAAPLKKALPAIIALLNLSGPKDINLLVMQTLGKVGKDAKAALPVLRKFLGSEDEALAKAAESAISKIK
jgi:HEAT repeat protein